MKTLRCCLLLAVLAASVQTAPAQPPAFPPGLARGVAPGLGLIILAERRFDPFVQRLMVEQSLRALPLYGGQLFYLVPTSGSSGQAEMQIRYLEVLLRERGLRETEGEPGHGTAGTAAAPAN